MGGRISVAPAGNHHLRRLRSYCTQPRNNHNLVTQVVTLLKAPHHQWDPTKLNALLFPNPSSSSPSPAAPDRAFFDIARRLPSSSHAIRFLRYLRNDSPAADTNLLSSALQAVLELAAREKPDPGPKLLELYKASSVFNIPLTLSSAAFLIRALGRSGLVEDSVAVFNGLEKSVKNTHIYNVLVEVFLCNGREADAFKVLDEMLQPGSEFPPNKFTGDIVFYSGVKGVSEEDMVCLVLRFGERGVFPDSIWLTQVITRLCLKRKADVAWDLVCGLMKLLGESVEVACCNALLSGLGKINDLGKMRGLMARMKEFGIKPNEITFGIFIKNLCKFGMVDEALEELRKMSGIDSNDDGAVGVKPDVVICNTLINGLCKVGRHEEGLGLMRKMKLQHGCAPNVVTYNCLIDGFCKAREIERGKELFDEMQREGILPNVNTFNCLIHGMCRHGRGNTAFKLFCEMQRRGLKGNPMTYTSLVSAFCSMNNIEKAVEIFSCMSRDGCAPDAIAYFGMISGLSQAGRMYDACALLSKMKDAGFHPDLKSYNTIISGLCKKKKLEKVYELIKEMEEAGLQADHVTHNILISYFSKAGDLNVAHRLLKKMTNEGFAPTVFTYGALIDAYCLHGDVDEAMKIFEAMEAAPYAEPNTVIYNILIDCFCQNNEVERALSLMDRMRIKGVRPDTTTYNSVFKGLREKKMLDTVYKMMDEMIEHDCSPNYVTLEILTEWLSAVGETNRLKDFVHGF